MAWGGIPGHRARAEGGTGIRERGDSWTWPGWWRWRGGSTTQQVSACDRWSGKRTVSVQIQFARPQLAARGDQPTGEERGWGRDRRFALGAVHPRGLGERTQAWNPAERLGLEMTEKSLSALKSLPRVGVSHRGAGCGPVGFTAVSQRLEQCPAWRILNKHAGISSPGALAEHGPLGSTSY